MRLNTDGGENPKHIRKPEHLLSNETRPSTPGSMGDGLRSQLLDGRQNQTYLKSTNIQYSESIDVMDIDQSIASTSVFVPNENSLDAVAAALAKGIEGLLERLPKVNTNASLPTPYEIRLQNLKKKVSKTGDPGSERSNSRKISVTKSSTSNKSDNSKKSEHKKIEISSAPIIINKNDRIQNSWSLNSDFNNPYTFSCPNDYMQHPNIIPDNIYINNNVQYDETDLITPMVLKNTPKSPPSPSRRRNNYSPIYDLSPQIEPQNLHSPIPNIFVKNKFNK